MHERIVWPVAGRPNTVTRHITSTLQAMTQTQTLRNHGRQQCYGTLKTRPDIGDGLRWAGAAFWPEAPRH